MTIKTTDALEILKKLRGSDAELQTAYDDAQWHLEECMEFYEEGKKQGAAEQRDWLLEIIHDLCLCDHMGDVSNVMSDMLKHFGIEVEWNEFDELATKIEAILTQGGEGEEGA